jgi:hypothetical protein
MVVPTPSLPGVVPVGSGQTALVSRLGWTGNWGIAGVFPTDYKAQWSNLANNIYFAENEKTNENWQQMSIKSPPVPYNGIGYLQTHFFSYSNKTQIKNLKVVVRFRINESLSLTGQTHTQTQLDNIKNKQDEDISIDTSRRNSIKGTLFIQGYDGAINKRALAFAYADDLDGRTLGDLITKEDLKFNYVPRMIVDGDFYTTQQVNPLFGVEYNQFPSKIFNFGLLEIDYRNCKITSQIYERQDNNEKEFNTEYEFKYLSENT